MSKQIRKEFTDIFGNTFQSISAFTKHYKIRNIYKAFEQEYSLEEIMLLSPLYKCKDHNGKEFKNINEMSTYYGIQTKMYRNRLRNGLTKKEALERPYDYLLQSRIITFPYKVGNEIINNKKEIKSKLGISSKTFFTLLESNYSIENFLKEKRLLDNYYGLPTKNGKIFYNNDFYENLNDICTSHHVSRSKFIESVKAGKTFEEALTPQPRKSIIKDRTGEEKTLKDGTKAQIIDYTNYHNITVKLEDGRIINTNYWLWSNGIIRESNYNALDVFSKNEYLLYYFFSKCGFEKIRSKERSLSLGLNNFFPDLYNPDKNIVIEYDGKLYHNNDRDILKDRFYESIGATVFRIRENGLPQLNSTTSKQYILNDNSVGSKNLEDVANQIINEIKNITKDNSFNINIDFSEYQHILNTANENFFHSKSKKNRVGKISTNRQGEKMKVIRYNTCMDIDVEFENGAIATNRSFADFKRGFIKNPFPKLNTSLISSTGQKITVTKKSDKQNSKYLFFKCADGNEHECYVKTFDNFTVTEEYLTFFSNKAPIIDTNTGIIYPTKRDFESQLGIPVSNEILSRNSPHAHKSKYGNFIFLKTYILNNPSYNPPQDYTAFKDVIDYQKEHGVVDYSNNTIHAIKDLAKYNFIHNEKTD